MWRRVPKQDRPGGITSRPVGKRISDVSQHHLAARDGDHEIVGIVIGSLDPDAVQIQEHQGRQPSQSFVAVHERMIVDKRVHESRSLELQRRIRLLTP